MRRMRQTFGALFLTLLLLAPVFSSSRQTKIAEALHLASPRIVQEIDEARRTVLANNTDRHVRPEFDQGPVDPDMVMHRMLLVMKRSPDQEAALRKFLLELHETASPNYHRWITPEQFGQRFGVAEQDIRKVSSWLASHGLQIGSVSKGRSFIEFSGTAAQVRDTFHTEIHRFVVNGEAHWANASDPSIPSALSPVVAGPASLHNFRKHSNVSPFIQRATFHRTPSGDVNLTNSQNQTIHALGPADLAAIYNIPNSFSTAPSPLSGSGITIGVVGRSNINLNDILHFRNAFGFNTALNFHVVVNGPDPGNLGGGEEVEAVLDASWAGAAAPQADVMFVVSQSTETTDGVDLSEIFIVDNNLADIMTESFGACEQDVAAGFGNAEENIAEQAAAQGITFFAATGDSGAVCTFSSAKTVATQIPASLPFVTAVGGTIFTPADSSFWKNSSDPISLESATGYIPENVWSETINGQQGASGGGISILFGAPPWQKGVPGLSGTVNRQVPDISMTAAADHDPYIVCIDDFNADCSPATQTSQVILVGGTSAPTPTFGGIMALVDESQGKARQGEAGFVFYKLAAAEVNNPTLSNCNASALPSGPTSASCVFNDVTVGNNVITGEIGSTTDFQAGPGYDLATGLGSLNVTNLINAWSTVRTIGTNVVVSSQTPFPITHSQSASFTITVSPQSGNATPSGNVSLIAHTGTSGSETVVSLVLNNGSITAVTDSLPGGQYNVTAHYEGDGIFAPRDSSTSVGVNVMPEASTTQIQLVLVDPSTGKITNGVTSAAYGSNDALRVDVSASMSGACPRSPFSFGCPTGNVLITANGLPFDGGTFPLNSLGYAEDQMTAVSLHPGNYQMAATYSGDPSYSPSGPATDSLTITQATTTTTVSSSPNSIQPGGTVTLTADISTQSFGDPPTGTVTFFNGSTPLGNPVGVTRSRSTSLLGFVQASATLTTTLSSSPWPTGPSNRLPLILNLSVLLITCLAIVWLRSFSRVSQANSHRFVYLVFILVLLLVGGISACGGGGDGGGGGGGVQHNDMITAKYSGDANYSSSTSPSTIVTIQ